MSRQPTPTDIPGERERWNQRYRQGPHSSKDPDPFLVTAYRDFISPLFPKAGAALDLAGGTGRHSVWLAQRGWNVTLVDFSDIGIARAKKNAADAGVEIDLRQAEIGAYRPGRARFDLILVFYYLERKAFAKLAAALRRGGLLVYKTYTLEHRKYGHGPTHPMYFLRQNELLTAFPGFRILHYRETVAERGIAELVAQRRP
jgi:SAM-dependent methyltransferase